MVRCPEQAGRPFRIVADSPRLHAGDPHKSSGNHTRVVVEGEASRRRKRSLRALLAPERAPGELVYLRFRRSENGVKRTEKAYETPVINGLSRSRKQFREAHKRAFYYGQVVRLRV